MSDFSSILVHSHCLSKGQMLAYIQQKLDREEMHLVESHLNDCQFCNDAFDAFMEVDLLQAEQDIASVKTELTNKLFPAPAITPAPPASKKNNTDNVRDFAISKKTLTRWLAAASVLLLIGLGGYSVFSYINSDKNNLALEEKEKGGAGYKADYAPVPDEHDEIVRLNVEENDTFRKYATETDKKSKIEGPVATGTASEASREVTTKLDETPDVVYDKLSKAVPVEKIPEAELKNEAPAMQANKDYNANIDPAPGMDNYSRAGKDEKPVQLQQKEVAKKKSGGGMRYNNDNNMSQNQMRGNVTNEYLDRGNQNNYQTPQAPQAVQTEGKKQDVLKEEEKGVAEKSNYEMGMDNFNNQNYKKSISYFEKALKKATGAEREDIMYHLALAYEKTGKDRKANELFAALAGSKKYGQNAELKMREKSEAEKTKK